MKKIAAAGAAALLVLSLAACGRHNDAPPGADIEPSIPIMLVESKPQQTTEATEATEAAPVPTEGTKPAEKPAVKPKPEEKPKPTDKPEPTEKPKPTKPPRKAAPELTKSPTDETVKAGEDAWFVARADHADGIRWWLNTPQGGRDLTPEEAMHQVKGLVTQIIGQDTLILTKVPQEMEGWSVRAEFYNSTGSTYSKKAILHIQQEETEPTVDPNTNDPLELYMPVFRDCMYIMGNDPRKVSQEDLEKHDPYNLAEGWELLGEDRLLGYVLMDVDRDGTKELILGAAEENEFGENGGEIVYAMFTLRDRKPVKLVQSFERNRFYLAKDRRIYNEGSSGAANSVFNLYTLAGDTLTLRECLWSNGTDENGNLKMFHTADGTTTENDDTRINGEVFDQILQSMSDNKLPLPTLTAVS